MYPSQAFLQIFRTEDEHDLKVECLLEREPFGNRRYLAGPDIYPSAKEGKHPITECLEYNRQAGKYEYLLFVHTQ